MLENPSLASAEQLGSQPVSGQKRLRLCGHVTLLPALDPVGGALPLCARRRALSLQRP